MCKNEAEHDVKLKDSGKAVLGVTPTEPFLSLGGFGVGGLVLHQSPRWMVVVRVTFTRDFGVSIKGVGMTGETGRDVAECIFGRIGPGMILGRSHLTGSIECVQPFLC